MTTHDDAQDAPAGWRGAEGLARIQTDFRRLFDAVRDELVIVRTADAAIVDANPAGVTGFHRPREVLLGTSLFDMVEPPDRAALEALRDELVETGRIDAGVEVTYLHPEAGPTPVRLQITGAVLAGGNHAAVLIRDVTDSEDARQRLRESEARYRSLIEAANDPIFQFTPEGHVVSLNPAAARAVGHTPESARGKHMRDLFPDEVAAKQLQAIQEVAATGRPMLNQVSPVPVRDGVRWFHTSLVPVRGQTGQVTSVVGISRDITAQRQAEEALRRAAEEKALVLSSVSELVLYHAPDLRVLWANRAAAESVGMETTDLVGRMCYEVWHGRDTVCPNCPVQAALATGEPKKGEVTSPGGRIWEIHGSPVRDPEGKVVGAVEVTIDITERRRTEDALRQSEARYRSLFENSPVSLWLEDLSGVQALLDDLQAKGVQDLVAWFEDHPEDARRCAAAVRVLDVNQATIDLYEAESADDLLGNLEQILPFEAFPATIKAHLELQAGRTPSFEAVNRALTGKQLDVSLRFAAVPGGREALGHVLISVIDVTERNRVLAELRAGEERYRAVVQDQTEWIGRFTPDGRITFVNEAVCRDFGVRPEAFQGTSFLDHVHPDDVAPIRKAIASLTPDHPVVELENRARTPDGDGYRWVRWINRGIFGEAGRLVEVQAVGRDITKRRMAEEALRASEANYRSLFEQSADGVVVILDGRVVQSNPAFDAIAGLPHDECIGSDPYAALHPDDRVLALERRALLERGQAVPPSSPWRMIRRDGSVVWIEVRSRPVLWRGRPAIQALVRDVTEQRMLEQRLLEAEKMEAVGQLAGGVAHDFNNLMTGILCTAELLRRGHDDPEALLRSIETDARRAAGLTSQLLGFARKGKHENVLVDLGETARRVLRLAEHTLPDAVIADLDVAAETPVVRGDPAQVEQVVLNLVTNAADAMPEGGTIRVAVEVPERGALGPEAFPGPTVLLRVTDTGTGIPEDLRDRIFEPFFTTKPRGKGTGMGLAMVYGAVQNHGGWVEVESEVGRGSTFRVFLPAAGAAGEDAEDDAAGAPAGAFGAERRKDGGPDGGATVLVIDDEQAIRRGLERMLTEVGFEVATASDGREAVAYLDAGGHADLALVDMRMPGMDGPACLRALRERLPGLPALFLSGYGFEEDDPALAEAGAAGYLRKPFRFNELVDAVVRVLAGRSPREH